MGAASNPAMLDPNSTQNWWTLELEKAAQREPSRVVLPSLAHHYAFLAWLAVALGRVRLIRSQAAGDLAEVLLDAGLVDADEAASSLTVLTADEVPPAIAGLTLVHGGMSRAAHERLAELDYIGFQGEPDLLLCAPRNSLQGPVGALLRAARDPVQARTIATLFTTRSELVLLRAQLDVVTREVELLRRARAQSDARARAEAAHRQSIENSAVWRAAQFGIRWINARPWLAGLARRTARIVWHRIVRPLLASRASAPMPGQAVMGEATLCIAGVGLFVFARTSLLADSVTRASLVSDGRVIEPLGPPRATAAGLGARYIGAFYPDAVAPAVGTALQIGDAAGTVVERPLPKLETLDPRAAIQALLARLTPAPDAAPALLTEQILPAVEACWAAVRRAPVDVQETIFGQPPTQPKISIVVPLYGRMDWLLIQAAEFSNEQYLLTMAEVIYVVDDPQNADEALRIARIAYESYGVPLRVLRLSRNVGYSTATNIGARAARGGRLLLLNSDVVPIEPGWLEHLYRTYDEIPDCGALGCRLLFDDGTLQHAGMSFERSRTVDGWFCVHPHKGEAASRDQGGEPREVAGVTGACLMIERGLYADVGGLSEEYIIGDFEDADLCHRVAGAGRGIWYDPRVSLTHFERQSFGAIGNAEWRYGLTLCNMVLHARRWRDRLSALTAGRSSAS